MNKRIAIAAVLALLLPYPWPVRSEITTMSAAGMTIRFYFRPAGLVGAITKDNPWVYATVTGSTAARSREIDVWADSPCDGVKRLSQELDLSPPACDDNAFL
jgi:hypothetical protein